MSSEIQYDSSPSKPQQQVPQWVGVMIALLLVSSMLAAGGYWIWARATQPPRDQLVEVQGLPQLRGGGIINVAPPANVTRSTGANNLVSYQVRAPDAVLSASKSGTDADWTMNFRYNRSDLMTPDQSAAITARFRLTSDPAFAKSLKVTEEQLTKLKQIPAGTPMIVGDADQKKMKASINAYNAAPKVDAEPALIKALTEISAASLNATRAAIADRAKNIQAILSAEQIAPFKQ